MKISRDYWKKGLSSRKRGTKKEPERIYRLERMTNTQNKHKNDQWKTLNEKESKNIYVRELNEEGVTYEETT